MIEMYRSINAEKVNDDVILINHTDTRVLYFEIFVLCPLGLMLIIQILSYNHQGLIEITITFLLLIITIILNIFKRKMCPKTIEFNRIKQTVIYKRTFPNINATYNFNNLDIKSKTINNITNDGQKLHYKKYLIQVKNKNISYRLCKSNPDMSFDSFINKYMESDKKTIKTLIHYNKTDDLELNKVVVN
ncbi:hypothetical protein V6246_04530 [Algibacter sp. TI.3.09]|uniref:hypothetical protein n=1 Tax=Algibacter sp. TI.3.09 TaxID=3121298 RepID=UPI00311D9C77